MSEKVWVAEMAEMNRDEFKSVYRGWAGECCCGCSGVHIPESDTRRFRRAFGRLEMLLGAGKMIMDEPEFVAAVDDRGAMYLAYRKA